MGDPWKVVLEKPDPVTDGELFRAHASYYCQLKCDAMRLGEIWANKDETHQAVITHRWKKDNDPIIITAEIDEPEDNEDIFPICTIIQIDDDVDHFSPVHCPICEGAAGLLGVLGRLHHFQCRYCGMQFAREAQEGQKSW